MAGRNSGGGGLSDSALSKKLAARKLWGRGSMLTSRHRTLGASAKMGGYFTLFLCMASPAHFDAVQIVLVSPATHDPTYTIKATLAAPARYNDGVNPQDAAGASITPTAVTWGTTDRNDPRNPGGGKANTAIVGASGASPNEIEARVYSDIMPIASLPRADAGVGTGLPLLMLRIQGADPPGIATAGLSGVATGNASIRAVEPDHWCQYLDGDFAATASGVAKTTNDANARWAPAVEIIFYHRGTRVWTIGSAGDSLQMGWGNTGTANGTAGLMDGWARKFARRLRQDFPTGFVSWQRDGYTATRFQEEAMNALVDGGIGLTHLFIPPSSVNNSISNPASVPLDLKRTGHLVDLCIRLGVTPIIVYPWAGQDIASANGIRIRQYVDAHKAAGGLTFDVRKLISSDGTDTTTSINAKWATRRADNSAVDFTHLNEAANQAIADAAYAQRGDWGLKLVA